VRGPAGAFGLTAVQILAGLFVFLWTTSMRYKVINRGYYRSTTWVLWPLMVATSFALPGGLRILGLLSGVVWALYLTAVYTQRPLLEWLSGAAGSVAALALLGAAGWQACEGGCSFGAAHGLLGGLVLGGVTHGMTLGHWYLNQARLPIEPLKEQTGLIIALLGLSGLAGLFTRTTLLEGEAPAGILTYSAGSYWWTWVLLLGATALVMAMVRVTVRDRSTQSATGLLYIATVTALAAQFVLDLLATT
jgi:hypothetical protein